MTTTRETNWHALVVQVDPEHTEKSRNVIEYEFSAPGRPSNADERTHDGGRRIFKGDYKNRGGYEE